MYTTSVGWFDIYGIFNLILQYNNKPQFDAIIDLATEIILTIMTESCNIIILLGTDPHN